MSKLYTSDKRPAFFKSTLLSLLLTFFLVAALGLNPTLAADKKNVQDFVAQIGEILKSQEFDSDGVKGHFGVEQTVFDESSQNLILRNLVADVPGQFNVKIAEITIGITQEVLTAAMNSKLPDADIVLPRFICKDIAAKMEKESLKIAEISLQDAVLSKTFVSAINAGQDFDHNAAIANFNLKDLIFKNLQYYEGEKQEPVFSLGKLGLYDLKAGSLAKISLEQIVSNYPDLKFKINGLNLSNVNVPAQDVQAMLLNTTALQGEAAKDAYVALGRALFFQEKPLFETISLDRVTFQIFGVPLEVANFGIGVGNQSIVSFWLKGITSRMLEQEVKLPFPLRADFVASANYLMNNPNTQLNLKIDKLADLNVTFSSKLKTLKASDITLTFKDTGAIAWAVFNAGIMDMLDKELASGVKDVVLELGPDPRNQQLAEQVMEFIKSPGTLTISSRFGFEIGQEELDQMNKDPGRFLTILAKPGVVPLRSQVKTCTEDWTKLKK